ncbi:thermonuclease family protein [Empedobacter falsenii]
MIRFFQFALSLILISCNHPESKDYERHTSYQNSISEPEAIEEKTGYKVIGIKDGDTFVLLIDGKEQTVRFAHIDCPEKKQSFGNRAKQFVSDMCFGTYITLKINPKNKQDRNKRLIAEIILEDGRNLNKELVKNGLAWHFKKYSDSEEYAQLETEARNNKIGLWSEPNPIAPWDWRKPKK